MGRLTSREGWLYFGYGYRRRTARAALRNRLGTQLHQVPCVNCGAAGQEPCDPASGGSLVRVDGPGGTAVHLDRARYALAAGLLDVAVLRAGLSTAVITEEGLAALGGEL